MILAQSLSHRYGDRLALDGLDLAVGRGSLFGLLGPNGSGKSTLFRILSTLLVPSGGRARVAGFDVVRDSGKVRRAIGVVFQSPSLDDRLTVQENMLCQGHLYGLSGADLRQRIASLLDRFGVADRCDDRVLVLSGGLKRRVEIAKAVLHQPPVLLLDEPGTGLDPAARRSMIGFLKPLCEQQGLTCLLTTHLMDEADACDGLAVLDAGRLVAHGDPASLKAQIGGDVIEIVSTAAAEVAATLRDRLSVDAREAGGIVRIAHPDGPGLIGRIAQLIPEQLDSIHLSGPTLEDVFFSVTGHRFEKEP